ERRRRARPRRIRRSAGADARARRGHGTFVHAGTRAARPARVPLPRRQGQRGDGQDGSAHRGPRRDPGRRGARRQAHHVRNPPAQDRRPRHHYDGLSAVSLSSTCISRPILTIVMSIAIIVFGVIGFTFLGVREYPNVDPAVITVNTNYAGTNADVIDSQVTQRLEEATNGIPGIRTLSSVSRDGQSQITIEFNLNVDLETAANDVRDKVAGAVGLLPPDADPPVVSKADANAFPIIVLYISSATRNLME